MQAGTCSSSHVATMPSLCCGCGLAGASTTSTFSMHSAWPPAHQGCFQAGLLGNCCAQGCLQLLTHQL